MTAIRPCELQDFMGATLLFCSSKMRDLMAMVQRVAPTDVSVLILGETGVGKELIARAIHHYSNRGSKPWIDVCCGALPEHLVESELFGYEKGAFSGAGACKPGLFEVAHTGTLFLDEIGELDPRLQSKLLRVLDGNTYFRLGGTRKVLVDVRIVAATNVEFEQGASDGRFRSDLYHRLGQVTLHVPPLRQRTEDILPLASFFLSRGFPGLELSGEASEMLLRYSWPGNVRQLKNVITRASLQADDGEVRVQHLPSEVKYSSRSQEEGNLRQLERKTILSVLDRTDGQLQKAAEVLGISSRTLNRKLKCYKLEEVGLAG